MIFNLKRLGASGLPVIDFDGDMLSAFSGDEWEAAFLESGTIRFNSNPGDCDIFLVADGKSGGTTSQAGYFPTRYYYGAGGGRGGNYRLARATLSAGVDYTLTIGDDTTLAGNGLSLSTADGNVGSNGGDGALCRVELYTEQMLLYTASINRQPGKGGNGVWAYNEAYDTTIISEFSGKRFSAGGGGGDACCSSLNVYCSSDNSGGETDGGAGAKNRRDALTEPAAGGENTGSGGGGARISYEGSDTLSAAGGSGICLIRRHRGA